MSYPRHLRSQVPWVVTALGGMAIVANGNVLSPRFLGAASFVIVAAGLIAWWDLREAVREKRSAS